MNIQMPPSAFVCQSTPCIRLLLAATKGAEAIGRAGLKPEDDTMVIPGSDPDIEWEVPWIALSMAQLAAAEY